MTQHCSLYLVSPPKIELHHFMPQLRAALGLGVVKAFQLRLKEADDAQLLEAAQEILPLCRAKEVAFVLNDRADLAAKIGADGLHLGQDDMGVADAREIVGDECIIGVSCHASRHMAMIACEKGADYVAFGAFYPTTSKPKEKIEKWGVPSPDILEEWSGATTIPCVAIGGITAQNCAPLVQKGADFIAAITSVWNHSQGPAIAVKEFAEAIAAAG
jgi:thiamine-phosphate pyrophosphorylase